MNKKLFLTFVSALLLTSCALAKGLTPIPVNHSMYLGLQAGLSYDGLKNKNELIPGINLIDLKRDKDINLSGRIFMGYNFNKNFAVEAGYLVTDQNEFKILIENTAIAKYKVKQSIIDFTPRINIPLGNKFTVYGRAGVAYIDIFNTGKDKKDFNLTYGAGLDYNISNNFSVGVAWAHYNGGSTKPIDIIYKKYQPALNFYGISVSYKVPA